jgi:hypothetical protein
LGNLEIRNDKFWWTVPRSSITTARRRVEAVKEPRQCESIHGGAGVQCGHFVVGKHTNHSVTLVWEDPPEQDPEPGAKPGTWLYECGWTIGECSNKHEHGRVFRAGTGWTRDTRTGEKWIIKSGDPVVATMKGHAGSLRQMLNALPNGEIGEQYSDYYKRIGLDVRPVDRRAKK